MSNNIIFNKKNVDNNNMKKYIFAILIIFTTISVTSQEYQYQYFNSKNMKYVPFSDYTPRIRIHYETVPHYVEDFYKLYSMKQH